VYGARPLMQSVMRHEASFGTAWSTDVGLDKSERSKQMSEQRVVTVDPSWPNYEFATITLGVAETISRALLIQPGGSLKVRNWCLKSFIAEGPYRKLHSVDEIIFLAAYRL
jgi:hypothetical protein